MKNIEIAKLATELAIADFKTHNKENTYYYNNEDLKELFEKYYELIKKTIDKE